MVKTSHPVVTCSVGGKGDYGRFRKERCIKVTLLSVETGGSLT